MLEFIREAPGQRTALAALAERAFLQNGAAVHFASLLPKLYGQEACAQPVHTLLLENGTPAGLFALQVSEFQIAGMPLRVSVRAMRSAPCLVRAKTSVERSGARRSSSASRALLSGCSTK